MEEQKGKCFKEFFLGNETIEKREKWFNFYKKLPTILFISILVIFFIWGIIDPSVFGYHSWKSEDCEYGVMMLPSGFLCWFIWQIVGIIVASLTFVFTKISLSYKILHIEYLKTIASKIR